MEDGEEGEGRSQSGAHLRSFCPFGKWVKEEKQQKVRRRAGPNLSLRLYILRSRLTTELSVLMDFMCRKSSAPLGELLSSILSLWSLSLLPPSFSLLGPGGLGTRSLRCFLVTCASGPWTVFTCFLRELGSV